MTITRDITLHPGSYHRPQMTDFPTVGFLLLVKLTMGLPTPFVFQITHNADKHDVGQVGVGVDRSDVHQYTHKFLAVITPTGVSSWIMVLFNR